MRLIDADVLIKHFEAIQKREDAIGLNFIAIADEIKEQPTAYDLDKVVEQLEGFAKRYDRLTLATKDTSWIRDYISKAEAYRVAIEIVKAGGKNE